MIDWSIPVVVAVVALAAAVYASLRGRRVVVRAFLSYRHDTCTDISGRLREQIERRFGSAAVFLDTVSLVAGEDFPCRLREEIARCTALLVLMDKDWASVPSTRGGRRLDDPNDFVRQEIEAAKRLGRRLIPVLVHGADMPSADDWPESVEALSSSHAIRILDEPFFRASVDQLLNALSPPPPRALFPWAAALLVLAAGGIGVGLASREPGKIPAENPFIGSVTPTEAATPPSVLDSATPGDRGPNPETAPRPQPNHSVGAAAGGFTEFVPRKCVVSVGGFSVALPDRLPKARSKNPPSYPVSEAVGAVTGQGFLVLLSRRADLPSGDWYLQDARKFGESSALEFRNWDPQGEFEGACLLLHPHSDLSTLGDILSKPVGMQIDGVKVKVCGQVSAKRIDGFMSPGVRSAAHTVWVLE